jgi:hypothetical protein
MRARACALAGFISLGLGSAQAQAASSEDAAAAQGLFDQARKLVAAGHAQEACPKFEESQRLDPGLGTEFNLADCYERTGRVASAWTLYLQVASEARSAGQADREQLARERAQALVSRLPTLTIVVPEPVRVKGLKVTRSGTIVGAPQWGVPVPVDPGAHPVQAEAPGYDAWQGTVSVEGGAAASIEIPPLHASPEGAKPAGSPGTHDVEGSAKTPTLRWVAYGLGAAGVIGLGVGTVFGVKAMSSKNDAGCDGRVCPSDDAKSKYEDARSSGNVATAGFIAGGVLLGAGVVLYFVSSPKKGAPTVGLRGTVNAQTASVSLGGAW